MPKVEGKPVKEPEGFFKKNEVSDFAAEVAKSETLSLNTHLAAGRKISPGTSAKVARLQSKTGLPNQVVHDNLEKLEAQDAANDLPPDFWRKSPLTAEYIRKNSPFYAGMTNEEILSMGNTENLLAKDPAIWRRPQKDIERQAQKRAERLFAKTTGIGSFDPNRFKLSEDVVELTEEQTKQQFQLMLDQSRKELEFEEDFIGSDAPVEGLEALKKRFNENSSFMLPFISALDDATRLTDLFRSAIAVQEGTANEDQVDTLVRYGRLAEASERRGQTVTGITANIGAELVPFAVELGLTGGIYNSAKLASTKLTKDALEKLLRDSVQTVLKRKLPLAGAADSFITRNTGRVVGTLVQSVAAGPGRIASTVAQAMTPIGQTQFGNDGSVTFQVTPDSGQPFFVALKEGVYRQFTEVFSEKTGLLFGRAFAKTPVGKAMLARFQKGGGKVEAFTKKLQKFGIHGVFAEMGEEEVAKLMIDIGGFEPYELPSLKQLKAQALAFGAPAVIKGGLAFVDRNLESASEEYLNEMAVQVEEDATILENQPVEYKRMIHDSVKGTDKENVAMPIEQFNQVFEGKKDEEGRDINPRDVIKEVMGDPKAYDEALETGGDISIPMEEFLTTLNQSDFAPEIRNITKFTPLDVTSAETEKILSEMEANITEQEPGLEDQERRAQFAISAQRVADDIRSQFDETTSKFNVVTANNYAKLYERVFRTLGLRSGEDPFELYERYSLGITEVLPDKEGTAKLEEELSEEELIKIIQENKAVREQALTELRDIEVETDPIETSQIVKVAERAERRAKRQLKKLRDKDGESVFFEQKPDMQLTKGNIGFGENHKVDINLFEKADFTTFLHESGHFFLNILRDLAVSPTASEDIKANFEKTKRWLKEKPLKQVLAEILMNVKSLERRAKKDSELEQMAKNAREAFEMAKEGGQEFMDEFIDSFGKNVEKRFFGTLMTPYHEQWARGFELYLADPANSPVKELNGLFHIFRGWIVKAYENLLRLNVKLSPEIKDVMGSLLATKEELENSQAAQGAVPLFPEPLEVGMTEELAARYQKDINDALQKAEEELSAKTMELETRKKSAVWRERKKVIQPEVEEEANDMRVYKALANMQLGKNSDGTALQSGVMRVKLDKEELVELIGPERLGALPRPFIYTSKDGLNLDVASSVLGYDSVEEMIFEIELSEKKSDFIKNETERRLHEEFGDPLSPDILPEEVNDALHNEKRSQLLKKELDFLVSENFSSFKGLAQKISSPVPTVKEVRRRAEQIINAKEVGRIQPIIYKRGETKASRTAIDAMLKGDFQAATEAKKLELLNHELFRAASQAKKSIDKNIIGFRPIDRADKKLSKVRDMGLVRTAQGVLAEYDLGKGSEKTIEDHLDFLRKYGKADQADVLTDLVSRVVVNAKPFKESTFEEFMNMADTVNALWKLSKSAKTMDKEGKRITVQEGANELAEIIDERKKFKDAPDVPSIFGRTPKRDIKRGILGIKSALTRVESWIRAMDKGSPTGAFRTLIWNPIIQGTTKSRVKAEAFIKEFKGDLEVIKDGLAANTREIDAKEIGFVFKNKAQLIGALQHIGNKSNKSKLLRGREWGEFDEEGELNAENWERFRRRMEDEGILTKEDYEFLQKTWDIFERTKVDAQKAHIELYGFGFDEVVADPVETSFGTFRGGYAPAIIDYMDIENINNATHDQLMKASELDDLNNSFMFPTTAKGFVNTRNENYARPLQLSLELVPMHINKVMRFSFIEAPVRDVYDLLNNQTFRESLNRFDPTAIPDMLMPWLERTARQRVSTPSEGAFGFSGKFLDNLFRGLRKRSSQSIMFLSAVNALQQFTGISVAAAKIRPRYLRNSMVEYLKNPKTFGKDVTDKSDFMTTRNTTSVIEQLNEIEKIVIAPGALDKVRNMADRHALFLQLATQNYVDNIVWNAAYNQGIQELGLNEKQAILHGDAMVRETQGGFEPESISRAEAGTPFQRMFITFYGYFNMLANTLAAEFSVIMRTTTGMKRSGELFYVYLMGMAIPAVVAESISVALRGSFDEDDDEEYLDDYVGIFFGSQARTATAMVPGGTVVQSVINRFNDKWFDDRLSVSPAVSQLESAGKAFFSVPQALLNEGRASTAIKDTSALFDLLFGIPTKQFAKTTGFFVDLSSGDQESDNFIDFTKGVISGRSGND